MSRGFAVLDLETTGLAASRNDRVIEVGVVHLDQDFRIVKCLETLIDPQRDIGPTRIHGITAREVYGAPTFDEIAPAVTAALDGRVIVGHNIAFDLRFLAAEFGRAGHPFPDVVAIDTLALARDLLRSNRPPCFQLAVIAEHLGFSIDDVVGATGDGYRPEHSAYGDALVTAHVLAQFITMSSGAPYWDQMLDAAERVSWHRQVARPATRTKLRNGFHPSRRITDVLDTIETPVPTAASTAEYSAILDAALEDRILDAHEVDALVATAQRLGLDTITLGSLHRGHFDGIVEEAWADGILTPEESADIIRLAELLEIDDASLHNALQKQTAPAATGSESFSLEPGAVIVLTGDTGVPRCDLEAEIVDRGFIVGKSLTKKTSLLIAADTFSQSGKATKARQYGIAVLGAAEGLALIRS